MTKDNVPEIDSIWDEARQHIESGNHSKAIEIYKYILIRYANDDIAVEYAHAYLGDLFLTLKSLDHAEEHIKKAINLKPDKPGYRYILGFIYSCKEQWVKAIREFEAAVDRYPNNGEYLRGLGWATYSNGEVDKGLAYLEKANRLAPDNPNVLTDLAVANLCLPNTTRAIEYAQQAVRIEPTNLTAQNVLKQALGFNEKLLKVKKRPARPKVRDSKKAAIHFIHRFKVSLKDQPDIWRIIDIKENQMLSSLHKAIFEAFDRLEEHQYSFFLSNKPYDKASAYNSPGFDDDENAKLASRIRIDSIPLYGGPKFLYLFDYGDEWWHEVELLEVINKFTRASYPKVVEKQGKSPPQYPRR